MTAIGSFVHLVTLTTAGDTPDDPEGGYGETWIALDPPTWYCSIAPASATDLARVSGGLTTQTATHLIRGRAHAQLSAACRITFRDRVFDVVSVHADADADDALILVVAVERIGVIPAPPQPPQPPAAHAPTHLPGGSDPIAGIVVGPDAAVAGSIAVGANPAQSGAVRLEGGAAITFTYYGETAYPMIRTAPNGTEVHIGSNGIPTVCDDSLAVGTNPAQSGAIRLANNQAITARNADNTADVQVARIAPDNSVVVGASASLVQFAAPMYVGLPLWLEANTRLVEIAAPAPPTANYANLWLQDNGAGKSQLMIQFATGAPIAIATEP